MNKLKHNAYETLKMSLVHPLHLFINLSRLRSFEKLFPTLTWGGLEPQFASKGSYFEQNIKKVCRSNLEVKKHTLS